VNRPKGESPRVLVVATNVEREPFPVYPLGASMVSRALERSGVQVRGVDLATAEDPERELAEVIEHLDPELVALSIRAVDNVSLVDSRFYLPPVADIVRKVREMSRAPLVLGGSGYSLLPRPILLFLEGDFGIVGEGEESLARLAWQVHRGESPVPGRGLYVRRGGVVEGEGRSAPVDPVGWGEPSFDIFPIKTYLLTGGSAPVQTKRGCDQYCSYCSYPLLEGRAFRVRDPSAAAALMERAAATGAQHLHIVDNNFNMPAEHGSAVCAELASRSFQIPWTCYAAPKALDAGLTKAMASASCVSAEVGSEAGAEATLKAMRKSHTPEDIILADRCLGDAGITPAHFFIFGGPGETWETVEATLELIGRLTGVVASMMALRIYPGTALHLRALREGVVSREDDLLEPVFYLSPGLKAERLLERLLAFAASHPRFLILGHPVNANAPVLERFRRRGRQGPLWEFYQRAR